MMTSVDCSFNELGDDVDDEPGGGIADILAEIAGKTLGRPALQ